MSATPPASASDPRPLRFAFSDARRWVLIGSTIGACAYALLAAVTVVSFGWGPPRSPQVLIGAALTCLIGAGLAYRNRLFVGGVTCIGAVVFESSLSLISASTFPSVSMLAAPAIIVGAALLLNPRSATIVSSTVLIGTWPLVLLSPAVERSGVTGEVLYWLIAHTVISSAVWSLVTLWSSVVDKAFIAVVRKERELAETIERAPDGILVVNANDVVQVANPAALRLLGGSAAACIGRPMQAVLASEELVPDSSGGALDLGDSGERPRAWTLQRRDGMRVELEITWRAMDGGRRQLVLRDVSERMQAERVRREMELQLSHSQRLEAVGQLAGGIAHDFNNILTIVGTSAEVLRLELRDDGGHPLLDEILAAQERGAMLTRQLLAFARREVVQPRVFDLSQQVLTLRRLLQRVAGEQTKISCDVEPGCRIRADVGQMEQALVNLVGNARDAMPDGGTCTLSVVRMTNDDGETWVRLRVRDVGVGMDDATRGRAFEPFFTTKPRGRGTGLGLSAVHGMVLQSGGRADIESTLGLGTTVILEFPFADAPASVPEERPEPVQGVSGGTILVAEDDDGTRASVARILKRQGYRVLLAPDGLQALRMAETHAGQFDLLVTDVMMPGLTGPKLAARLQTIAPGVPVLYMSGYPEDALSEVAGLHLETDFIAKPFTSAQLARRVSDKLAAAAMSTGGTRQR